MFVTTSRRGTEIEVAEAKAVADRLDLPYVERTGPLAPEAGPALVVTKERLVIETSAGQLFFHPGMSRHRIRALEQGRNDVMIEAMGLTAGQSVLDCTLGLGADALVAAFVVGEAGRIVGVEAVPALAEVVRIGLATYQFKHAPIVEAMRRIEVVCADHGQYLSSLPDNCYDVVYFDPLFREPVRETIHMQPWRELGEQKPLTRETLREACRVAKRRVVVKERSDGQVFEELGITNVVGGKSSRIAYGVLEAASC